MKYLQKKYALSDEGAKDLLKGIVYSVLAYVSLMLPVALLAIVLDSTRRRSGSRERHTQRTYGKRRTLCKTCKIADSVG